MPFACLLAPHLLAVHCALYGCILCICISHINVASHVFVPINRDSYSMCWPCIRPKNQFQSHCVQYEGHLYCTPCELCRNHLFFFQFGSIYTVSPIVFHFSHPQTIHTRTQTLSMYYYRESIDHFHVHFQPGTTKWLGDTTKPHHIQKESGSRTQYQCANLIGRHFFSTQKHMTLTMGRGWMKTLSQR